MLSHAVAHIQELTLTILMDFYCEDWGDLVDLSLPKRGMGEGETKVVEILSSLGSGHTAAVAPPPTLQNVDRSFRCSLSVTLGPCAKAVRFRTRRRQNSLPPST